MAYYERDVFSSDEVVVRAWGNGGDGPAVLICNGLGAPAECWPGLYDDPDCGFDVVSFFHRGTMGSGRPLDESATYLSDYAADALAVIEDLGLTDVTLVGWSVGVPVAFEVARQHPVNGILAVSGVPRGTEGIHRVIDMFNGALTSGAFHAARTLPGPILDLLGQIPASDATVTFLRHSGLVSAEADPQLVAAALAKYLEHDPSWYLKLADYAARTEPSGDLGDAGNLDVPTRFLTGRGDPFVPFQSVVAAAAQIEGASCEVVGGSHFLPIEHPELIRHELMELTRG